MLRIAFYLALSVASTWPLAWRLASHYPRGAEPVATVPFASAWALWWTSDRAAHGFTDYWHAPTFHPVQDAFALSEPMPLLGLLVTPLLWLGLPLVLAYNLLLLAALTCNGVFAERLLRRWRVAHPWAGAALVSLLPGLHHELGVLTLVPLAGVLACLHYAWRPKGGVALGLSFAAAYLCCAQYALMLALAMIPFLRARRSYAVAALSAGLLLAPIVIAQREAVAEHHLVRSEERVREGSARLGDYAWAAPAVVPSPVRVDRGANIALYPGTLHILLAVLGAAWALRRPARRRTASLLLAFAAIAFVLSISPRLALAGHTLHGVLASFVPGLAQVRSIWRAGLFVQLALTLLAALGLHALQRRRYLPIVLLALALLEVWPRPPHFTRAPDEAALEPWATFMRQRSQEPYCLLPFAAGGDVRAFEETARFMALTHLHGRPMLNGYSSYFPEPHEQLWRAPPRLGDAASAARLRSRGVRQVVSFSDTASWPVLFRDDATGLRVYGVP